MNTVIATPLFPPDTGGPATDSALLEKKLPEHGITTTVYSFGAVRHLPTGIRHLVYAFGLYKRARKADCIIAMDTFSVCVPAAFVALISGKRFVIRVPGDFVWEQSVQRFGIKDSLETFQQKRYGFRIELLRSLQCWAVRRADLVVACSDFLKKIVSSWGVKEGRLIRIYLGMDFDESYTTPVHVPEGKILFSLGRFVPWKGFVFLIDLIDVLSPEWHLVIAGDGPLRHSLEQQARDLGVSTRVTFLGAISHKEVLGWLRTASAFALNTSFESFSFQILEAMTSGTPIIATTAGSIPELVRQEIDGVLCSPDNKEQFKKSVESIVDEPEVWQQRVTSAKLRAQEFSTQKSIDSFAKELKKICA